MDLTSYLLGKNSGGGGSGSYTIKAGTGSSFPGFTYTLEEIEEVTIDGTSGNYLFYGYKGEKLPKIKGSNISTFSGTFQNCSNVLIFDLSNVTGASSVTNINNMFSGCGKATIIDLSSFETFGTLTTNSAFNSCGTNCLKSDGAYADGIPYVYVKNATVQNRIISIKTGWSTSNVIVKQ